MGDPPPEGFDVTCGRSDRTKDEMTRGMRAVARTRLGSVDSMVSVGRAGVERKLGDRRIRAKKERCWRGVDRRAKVKGRERDERESGKGYGRGKEEAGRTRLRQNGRSTSTSSLPQLDARTRDIGAPFGKSGRSHTDGGRAKGDRPSESSSARTPVQSSSSTTPSSSTVSGNHPQSFSLTRPSSPGRPVTSTPSASSASRCRSAPGPPSPRDEIWPVEERTRCQGTVSSWRCLRAAGEARRKGRVGSCDGKGLDETRERGAPWPTMRE